MSGGNGASYSPYADGPKGVSMMMPEPNLDGSLPSCTQRWFPHTAKYRLTTLIIVIDIVMFIITLIVGGAKYDGAFVSGNSMGGPSTLTLYNMGGKWMIDIRDGAVWRLFTSIILHAGILHLLSNVFFTVRFGYTLELRWGWPKLLFVYIASGIGASLWSCVLSYKAVSVGASGALFGIIGADIAYLAYNWNEIPHAQQEACTIAILTIITFLFGINTTVDNFAHIGGLIMGFFLGMFVPVTLVKREKQWEYGWKGAGIAGYCGLFLLFSLLLWVGNPGGFYPE